MVTLVSFQARFDELYRKFETYTGGEELFGNYVSRFYLKLKINSILNLTLKEFQLREI